MFGLGGCSLSPMGLPRHRETEFEGAYCFFVLQHNLIILSARQAGSDECTDSKVPVDNTVGLANAQISTHAHTHTHTHAAPQV